MSHLRIDSHCIMTSQESGAALPGRELAALSQTIVGLLPLGVLVCTDGIVQFVNDASLALFGACSADDLNGKHLLQFIHPHERESLRCFLDSSMDRTISTTRKTIRILKLDGTEHVLEAVLCPEANSASTVVFVKTVDEQQSLDESVLQSEEKYRTLVEESLDAMMILSAEGNLMSVNQAGVRLFGSTSASAVLGKNLNTDFCLQPKQREVLVQALNRQGFIRNFEYEVKRADGSRRRVLENTTAIYDSNGRIVAHRSTLRDITEWKHLEQQMFQAQKMESMTALVAGVGHDFINVLNNLQGFAGQLKKYAGEETKVQKYAATIDKSTERGLGLAKQLLSFAKPKKPSSSSANVGAVIAEIRELMEETFSKNILIDTFVEENLPAVNTDSGDIYQVLINICLNAQDAMNGNGTLQITATVGSIESECTSLDEATRQCVKVVVRDNGPGIRRDIQNRIFDPFFTTKERGKGSGLGLSIVYNIMKINNGVIDVQSEEHVGTTFTLSFPVGEAQMKSSESRSQPDCGASHNELILLVDDEQTMQELGKELLEEQGYRVMVAKDGLEAVEIFRRHSGDISLVILDLLMPKLDGGQAYLELKKIDSRVKAFFCTGFTPGDMIGSLLARESLVALQKPFRPDEFLRTVRQELVAH